jgi:ferredoxin
MTFVVTESCTRCKYTDCAVSAIYAEEDAPSDQLDFTPINAELSLKWKTITRTKPSLPDADAWSEAKDKRNPLLR